MEQSFLLKFLLHFFTLFIALFAGSISFRRLSNGQKIILAHNYVVLFFGIWGAIRIYNGLYSIPLNSVGEFIVLGIQLLYIDNELEIFRKKKLFRIVGVILLISIPLQWMILGSLNYQSDSTILVHLYVISCLFYCIIYRPVNTSDQLLRWALLLFGTGYFFHAVFADYITWNLAHDLSLRLTKLFYRLSDLEMLLIAISFLMSNFRNKNSYQIKD